MATRTRIQVRRRPTITKPRYSTGIQREREFMCNAPPRGLKTATRVPESDPGGSRTITVEQCSATNCTKPRDTKMFCYDHYFLHLYASYESEPEVETDSEPDSEPDF